MKEPPGHDAGLPYHASLLGDPHRVAAYERALRAMVRPDTVVLDVGTGTGLLAMMAARCGARRVHAVESMPIEQAARSLVAANGLADRVVVHRADIRTMAAVEPVDVIVSDFMGRWVADDQMLEALQVACERWLKPGGVIVPSNVRMLAAPVEIPRFAALDLWVGSIAGIDMSPLAERALQQCYGVALGPEGLLAEPEPYLDVVTQRVGSLTWDVALEWSVQRPGMLRGVAGWFEAHLTADVRLTTAPGVQTHWAQYLFPVAATAVEAGDTLTARIQRVDGMWEWKGSVRRAERIIMSFDHQQRTSQDLEALPEQRVSLTRSLERSEAFNREGGARYEAGDVAGAAESFARAAQHAPHDADEAFTRGLYENLGMMRYFEGKQDLAIIALLRALDGDVVSREQSARFLVNAYFAAGRRHDGAQQLDRYEATFGPHPSQWRRNQTLPIAFSEET